MPYAKDNAKMTGDTHLPDVESDMYDEGSADAVGMEETASDRGQATQRGDQKRPARSVSKATKAGPPRGAGKPRPQEKVPAGADFAITSSGRIPAQTVVARIAGQGGAPQYHSG